MERFINAEARTSMSI